MVGQEDLTAKEALLRWAQKTTHKYPGVKVQVYNYFLSTFFNLKIRDSDPSRFSQTEPDHLDTDLPDEIKSKMFINNASDNRILKLGSHTVK